MTYRVGYFVGSLSSKSINRELAKVLIRLAPEDLEFEEIPIGNLPLYSPDYDADYPPEAVALKDAIKRSQALLFVTPEYNRSIPGALKNAIDWASRPWGQNSFNHPPRPRRLDGADRHRCGAAEPARRAQLLQRPADDRPGGVHPLQARRSSPATARWRTSRPRRSSPTTWPSSTTTSSGCSTVLPRPDQTPS